MKNYFYKITNLVNGKFYYGSGSRKIYLGSGFILKRAKVKYGEENFKIEKLKFFETRKEAYEFEDKFLKLYNIASLKESYNIINNAHGGNYWKYMSDEQKDIIKLKISKLHKGRKHSDKTRERMSKTNLGENNPMYGTKASKETREKMSKANLGSKNSQARKIKCIGDIYETLTEALKYLKISKPTLIKRLRSDTYLDYIYLDK